MPGPLRVLVVEDSENDAELLVRTLERGGYEITHERVQTAEQMSAALRHPWDVVISDYSLPRFSGPAALALLKESESDLPFIMVSGTIGEDVAVEALKAGANDFLVKGRFARLIPAIERALREAEVRSRRRAAEAALRVREEHFRALAESATDAIISIDDTQAIVYANPAAARMFAAGGVSEIEGASIKTYLAEGTLARQLAADSVVSASSFEVLARRLDGAEFPAEVSLARWSVERRSYITLHVRDVSDRKTLEAQMIAADRLASVGTLAAGVAHEINNPLAAIITNLDLAEDATASIARVGNVGELGAVLADATAACKRLRDIVRDLRIFSRAEEDVRSAIDVERVLDSSLRLAWNEIRHRAQVVKKYSGPPTVLASEARLGQVFLNLIVNAAQAIEDGRVDANTITIRTALVGGDVVIDVTDTGPGMTSAVLQKLFTPFFTTKPAGVGTGLGLSICRRIVESMNGGIAARSEPGVGTTFTVRLPASGTAAATGQVVPTPARAREAARRGRVLAIDDDKIVAASIERALSPFHEVVSVSSAREALQLLRTDRAFDVVLCDVMMPDMTGVDVYAAIAEFAPETLKRIVFVTGGAFTPSARAFLDSVPNRRVEKPFGADELRAVVNEELA